MTDKQRLYLGYLFPVAAFVVARRVLGPPIFRGEFVVEDFILLLALAMGIVPSRFQPVLLSVIACSMSVTMTLMGWSIAARKPHSSQAIVSTVMFGLFATHSAACAVKELIKLRKREPNGAHPC